MLKFYLLLLTACLAFLRCSCKFVSWNSWDCCCSFRRKCSICTGCWPKLIAMVIGEHIPGGFKFISELLLSCIWSLFIPLAMMMVCDSWLMPSHKLLRLIMFLLDMSRSPKNVWGIPCWLPKLLLIGPNCFIWLWAGGLLWKVVGGCCCWMNWALGNPTTLGRGKALSGKGCWAT